MAALQAAPGQQVRRGRAGTSALSSLLTHRLPAPDPPLESPPPARPAASHLQGGRSAAPSPPSRSPDPSSTHRPGGCGAGGAIAAAAAAASAHPGAAGAGAQRRSHQAAEGAAPSAGHLGLAPRLPPAPSPPRWLPCALGPAAPVLRTPFCRQGPTGRGAGGLGRNDKSGGANSTRRPKGSWSQRGKHGGMGRWASCQPSARLHSQLWGPTGPLGCS